MATGNRASELAEVVAGDLVSKTDQDPMIRDVTHDSRMAGPGVLFVAIAGETSDGHQYAEQAVAAGSPALCVTRVQGTEVPEIVVSDTRAALGPLAASVHRHPSHSVRVVGVTGTNGKTTVTHYVESIAKIAGLTTGLVGTVHTRFADREVPSVRTTPEASDFQRLLAEMRDAGVAIAAVEVSSHALALHRVAGTSFEVAAFTNLSQDHLDFHGDMGAYLAAKRRLFEEYEVTTAVINVDDEAGAGIAASFEGDLVTVGSEGQVRGAVRAMLQEGTKLELISPWGSAEVFTPVRGRFNVDNALLATACSLASGISFEDTVAGLERLGPVPGRFEVVSGDDPLTVIVDYAHTPHGIAEAIAAARNLTSGRVVALAGAGGERDRQKRPLMGRALAAADLSIITSDNPRSEDPQTIVGSVAAGLPHGAETMVIVDRREAIQAAVAAAEDGDVILILGRGHEPIQEVGGQRVPFDDREVARDALARLRKSANSGLESGSMGA